MAIPLGIFTALKGAFEAEEAQRLAALMPVIDAIFSQHLRLAHADDLADPQESDSQLARPLPSRL